MELLISYCSHPDTENFEFGTLLSKILAIAVHGIAKYSILHMVGILILMYKKANRLSRTPASPRAQTQADVSRGGGNGDPG